LAHFGIYIKQTALLNVYILLLCLYKIYILIIFKISILRYFQTIVSISYRNWNPYIESSLHAVPMSSILNRHTALKHTAIFQKFHQSLFVTWE